VAGSAAGLAAGSVEYSAVHYTAIQRYTLSIQRYNLYLSTTSIYNLYLQPLSIYNLYRFDMRDLETRSATWIPGRVYPGVLTASWLDSEGLG